MGIGPQEMAGGKSRLEEQLCRIVAGFIRLALADRAEKEKRAERV
jgi:hypothetical protein